MEALTRCCRVPFDVLLNEATPISSNSDRVRLLHTSAERERKNSPCLSSMAIFKESGVNVQ